MQQEQVVEPCSHVRDFGSIALRSVSAILAEIGRRRQLAQAGSRHKSAAGTGRQLAQVGGCGGGIGY